MGRVEVIFKIILNMKNFLFFLFALISCQTSDYSLEFKQHYMLAKQNMEQVKVQKGVFLFKDRFSDGSINYIVLYEREPKSESIKDLVNAQQGLFYHLKTKTENDSLAFADALRCQ